MCNIHTQHMCANIHFPCVSIFDRRNGADLLADLLGAAIKNLLYMFDAMFYELKLINCNRRNGVEFVVDLLGGAAVNAGFYSLAWRTAFAGGVCVCVCVFVCVCG